MERLVQSNAVMLNARQFEIKPGPHAPQLAIQAHDLSRAECEALRWIICNNHQDSDDYKRSRAANPFLQGYQPPLRDGQKDGWILVEFWSMDRDAIDIYVNYINSVFAARVKRCEELLQLED
jgi:hypothetical protein